MTARRYAILSPVNIGPALELREGSQVVTFDTNSTSLSRRVMGDTGISSGSAQFEVFFFGDEALAGRVSVGVASTLDDLSAYVGGDADSWGYRAGDGQIHNSGGSVATVAVAQRTQCITVELDLESSPAQVRWRVDGLLIHAADLPSGATWYPAITVSGTTAYGLSALFNSGARAWTTTPQDGYADGWGAPKPSIGDLYLAPVGEDFMSGPADVPARQPFDGRMINAREIEIPQGVTFWPWRGQIDRLLARTSLRVANADGAYDYLLAFDGRDAEVTLYDADSADDLANARVIGTLLLESVRAENADTITITLSDVAGKLDAPWQTRLLPPWVADGAANRPWPVTLGAARNIEPVLTGTDESGRPIYVIHDGTILVATVRDRGDAFDAGADDYTLSAGGFTLAATPEGLVTCDASGAGDVPLPPSPVDVLAGIGFFEDDTDTDGVPDGWSESGDGSVTRQGTTGARNVLIQTTSVTLAEQRFYTTAPPMDADKRYRLRWRILDMTTTESPGAGQLPTYQFGVSLTGTGVLANTTPLTGPGTYEVTLGPWTGSTPRYLVWNLRNTQISGINRLIVLADVELFELPPPPPTVTDLEGITLEQFIAGVQSRAREPFLASTGDAADIDTATGYTIGAHFAAESRSIMDALQTPLDSFTAGTFADANGGMRFVRLVDPADVSDSDVLLSIERDQILQPPRIDYDRAPGLTTAAGLRRNWRRYSAGDFVTDFDPGTGVDAATRTAFERETQLVVQSGESLAQAYRHAERAPALVTAHESRVAAQEEIDRICRIYGELRRFALFPAVAFDGEVPLIPPGSIITIDWPRYGLDGGRKVFVVQYRPRHWAQQCSLLVWW